MFIKSANIQRSAFPRESANWPPLFLLTNVTTPFEINIINNVLSGSESKMKMINSISFFSIDSIIVKTSEVIIAKIVTFTVSSEKVRRRNDLMFEETNSRIISNITDMIILITGLKRPWGSSIFLSIKHTERNEYKITARNVGRTISKA